MTGRKKSVSRQKSGGRQKPSPKKSGGRKTKPRTLKMDNQGRWQFKMSEAERKTGTHDSLTKAHYGDIPTFNVNGQDYNPEVIAIDGAEYIKYHQIPTDLSETFDHASTLKRIGYDVAITENMAKRYGVQEGSVYALYRSAGEPTDFNIIPRVGQVSDQMQHYYGGWSTPANKMMVDVGKGTPQMIHLSDRLGQLRSYYQVEKDFKTFGVTARLDTSHDVGVINDGPQTSAYIKVEWENPKIYRSVPKNEQNDVAAIQAFQAMEEVFGHRQCFVQEYNTHSDSKAEMVVKVSNSWERGHARYAGEYRFGPLLESDQYESHE